MTNMEKLDRINSRINGIIKERDSELLSLDELIKEDGEAIERAYAAMQKATATGDLAAYQKAKADRINAQDAKEMHTARMTDIKGKPYVSEAEYEKTVSDILAAAAAAESETKKLLCELSNQMAAAAADLQEIGEAADKALHNWQHSIYRDADRAKHPQTGACYLNDEKHCKVFETVHWGRKAVQDPQYQAYTGSKGK